MTGIAGYDYVLTGYTWPNPGHITYSIAPDGVFWDHGTNILNAVVQREVRDQRDLAATDCPCAGHLGIGGQHQYRAGPRRSLRVQRPGERPVDPRFGDIRFGGYAFANNSTTLAQTYFPPPNGSTASGDVEINTSLNFNIGSTYDLYSVLLHETRPFAGAGSRQESGGGHEPGLRRRSDGVDSRRHRGDSVDLRSTFAGRLPAKGLGIGFGSAIDVSAGLAGATRPRSPASRSPPSATSSTFASRRLGYAAEPSR